MKTSEKGLNLIKQFEGCRLKAYKPVASEKYYTIGWGHYGADVLPNMTISQERADSLLVDDLGKYERYVNATGLKLNQNQFDALVSFTYNCGAGNLTKLITNRSMAQIADAMLLYNKGADKKELAGLTKRRKLERELFLSGGAESKKKVTPELVEQVLKGKYGSGNSRKAKLEAEGYDFFEVQEKVNYVLIKAKDLKKIKDEAGNYFDIILLQLV